MRKYLQVSFYTLTGIRKLIDLGDFVYGEWVIYNNKKPEYHIILFQNDASNLLIKSLLESKKETVDSIINKINIKQGTKLSLGTSPLIELIQKEELIELNLIPFPDHWVKNI